MILYPINIPTIASDVFYSKLKLPDGSYPLGTWRFIQVGEDLERQVQLVKGVWKFAGSFGLPLV